MISVIYLVYLFSQLSYFFSGFLGVLPDGYGFTAAEYARRGFFELAAVSVINLLLLFGASVFSKKVKGNVSPVLRVFGIFICAFNLVLAGTSISKMFLYINRFGLTRLRLYTSVFMLMMVFVIITVILRYLFRAFPYMRISIIACTLAGLCVLLCDADAAVARYNVNAYLEERLDSIDVYTIYELSDSAVVYLEKLYDEAKVVNVKQSAARAIVNLYDGRAVKDDNGRVISLGDKDFRSFTLTEYRANKILQSRYEECKSNMGDVKTRYSYRDSR